MAERLEVSDWQPIDTIPIDRPVMVKSVTGIECLARTPNRRTRWVREPSGCKPNRVSCWRVDGTRKGDISAVAWREPD